MTEVQSSLPSPEAYNKFIGGIELVGIRMAAGSFNAMVDRPKVGQTVVRIEVSHSYGHLDDAFDAKISFRTTFTDKKTDETVGSVAAEYLLTYTTSEPMVDEIWRVFADRNLRMNAWPYAREFVETATLRMGWPRFTLPVINSARTRKPRGTNK